MFAQFKIRNELIFCLKDRPLVCHFSLNNKNYMNIVVKRKERKSYKLIKRDEVIITYDFKGSLTHLTEKFLWTLSPYPYFLRLCNQISKCHMKLRITFGTSFKMETNN
jgi:hypothetical protein